MLKCDSQTYKDLEFDQLLKLLEEYCLGPTAKKRAIQLKPVKDNQELLKFLRQTFEMTNIKREGEPFPTLDFDEIQQEIKQLGIKNAVLSAKSFLSIRLASDLVNQLILFFKKREKAELELSNLVREVEYTKEIIRLIDVIFSPNGQIKDDASAELKQIRQEIESKRKHLHSVFERTKRKYLKKGYLGDILESFYDERRVLAIVSSYKREVNGRILGYSNSGAITFIEPGETIPLNNEVEQLKDDENKEIHRILRELTQQISAFLPLLKEYQKLLTQFDFINAKARLAILLDANLPSINEEKSIDIISGFHPILKLKHQKLGKPTIPQHIRMNKSSRMLVISGPNAGGKSITLKTVGILQLMLQCGLLIPVDSNSKMCFFDSLLTDIGDNQSIENELSTYSYRLKRMRYFLKVANENSLLLLDEFGTGSDPELGGALAEVFFEELYKKESFAVITTHYNNIKLKADELPEAINGCMLFDTESLQPLYKLSLGQPGSSFTFEVAQINGISPKLIRRAKSKLDKKKVKLDELLHELQKQESYLKRLANEHIEAQEIAEEHRIHHQEAKEKYDKKLKQIRLKSAESEKYIQFGKKFQQFIDSYKLGSKKKTANTELLDELHKFLVVEKTKIEDEKQRLKQKAKPKKAKKPKVVIKKNDFHQNRIKVGSKVKLISTRQVGEVVEISEDNVTVAFGFAKMKVKLGQLAWVEG